MNEHPVRLVVRDDLRRKRLTVFFRLFLGIPHYIWVFFWSLGALVAALVNWLIALATGRPARPLHRFLAAYIRYTTHLGAYLWLAAGPYPPFDGRLGEYPIDLELPDVSAQPRWKTLLRIPLALPALLLSAALAGGGPNVSWLFVVGGAALTSSFGLAGTCAFLGWFASVVRGRMPKGLRDAVALGLAYQAQTFAYVLLLTDRYPDANESARPEGVERPPTHPVHLVGDPDELRRSRVTVFFRLALAAPHLVWNALWFVLVLLVSVVQWVATLIRGRPIESLFRFTARWVRYRLHVTSFLLLVANPFPGFVGAPGYPLDVVLPGPARQNRWKTGFRWLLAIPALLVDGALSSMTFVCAIFMWFTGLFVARVPEGLRNLAAYGLRYDAQLMAYALLVTDAYPHASPLEGEFVEE